MTVSAGTVAPSVTVALTGAVTSVAAGSLVQAVFVTLAGQVAAANAGTLNKTGQDAVTVSGWLYSVPRERRTYSVRRENRTYRVAA